MAQNFPTLLIFGSDKLWLEEMYRRLINEEDTSTRALQIALWQKIPTDYDGLKSNERFIKNGRLTLLGVYQIDRNSELLKKTDIVVIRIRDLLFEDHTQRVIKAEEIAKITQISDYEVCVIFGFLADLDYVGVYSRAKKVGFNQVEIGGSHFEQYLEYEGIETLVNKSFIQNRKKIITSQNKRTELPSTKTQIKETQIMPIEVDPRKVFVVYGRNLEIYDAVCSFLRSINLDPMEWSEARKLTGKTNPYVGEILDAGFANAQAVLVLFTPDDIAKLLEPFIKDDDEKHEKEFTPQPRQNVIFEAGMAMAKFPERTVLVQVGKIRPMSDISGLYIIKLKNSTETRQDLAERLKDAGCDVKIEGKTRWHKEGNFELIPNSESQIQIIQSKIDLLNAPVVDLNDGEIEILKVLSEKEDSNLVALQIKLSELRPAYLKHYLNNLYNLDYITKFPGERNSDYYSITPKGLEYLVKNSQRISW